MGDPRTEMLFTIARGSGKTSMVYRLCEAMIRADVYRWVNLIDGTIHLVSANKDAPLTEEEKRNIVNYLGIRMFPYKVVFDD